LFLGDLAATLALDAFERSPFFPDAQLVAGSATYSAARLSACCCQVSHSGGALLTDEEGDWGLCGGHLVWFGCVSSG
jgi:hypothetical protein